MRILRRLAIGLALVALLLGGFVLHTLWLAGSFKHIAPHFAGSCTLVTGVSGAEDLAIDHQGRYAFLSASDRLAQHAGKPMPGGIWLYDLQRGGAPVNLTADAGLDFQPHGISLWHGPDGDRLFVINHVGPDRHRIEVFDWRGGKLTRRALLSSSLLASPNDIAAVDGERFYVTNDHGSNGIWRTAEEYLRLPLANVVYFDGRNFREVAGGIMLANGIAVSADGRQLYVAATTGREILSFDREPFTGTLSNRRETALGTAPDNIEPGEGGTLWVGAHPQILKLVAHADHPDRPSPSQVLKLTPRPGGEFAVDEIYLSDGRQMSASSTAAVAGKRLLIGSVYAPGFLDCRLP